MNIKKIYIIGLIFLILVFGIWLRIKSHPSKEGPIRIIHPQIGNIQTTVSSSGTVLPKNRLELKPPVNGRIEKVLANEGQKVHAGDTLIIMSSSERAALLDAARGQGEEKLQYWQDVYKPISLVAPIDGEIIVGTIQPGQTVTTSDPVLVLSDRLIVRAQVDETDIGKITSGQKAVISLDAYPDQQIQAAVDHLYYESKTVNNVTMYQVDLLPEKVPPFFRSGMNANVEFVKDSKENVLLLPLNVIQRERRKTFVQVQSDEKRTESREVVLGLSDDKNVEIVSGVSEADEVFVPSANYKLPQNKTGKNPFMPARNNNRKR